MWDTFKSHRIPAENLSASKLRRQTEQKEQPWANDSFLLIRNKETDYEDKENASIAQGYAREKTAKRGRPE